MFRLGDKVVITKVFTVKGNMESDDEFCIEDKEGNLFFVQKDDIWFEDETSPHGVQIKDDGV